MFNQTLVSAIGSLAPFWSNNLISTFSLGNEYSMAASMIITETIKYIGPHITDVHAFICICMICIVMIALKCGINLSMFDIFYTHPNIITLIAIEKIDGTQTILQCSKSFKAVNNMLITKYKIKQIRILKDLKSDIIVNDVKNLAIDKDLILNVRKDGEKITIQLQSNQMNLKELVAFAIENYYNMDDLNKLTFEGKEEGNTYDYPQAMLFLTYVLVNKYNMTKLKILSKKNHHVSSIHVGASEKEEFENQSKTVTELQIENIEAINRDFKNIFLLESCKEQLIEDDIYLDIERYNQTVIYTLRSNQSDLKEFFKKCMDIYRCDMSISEYKYSLKLIGYEISYGTSAHYHYPQELIALNYVLIEGKYVNHFRINTNNKNDTVKIIDPVLNLKIDNITLNIVRNVQIKANETRITNTYILESNENNLEQYINQCIEEYKTAIEKETYQKIYYFKYLGKLDKCLNTGTSLTSPFQFSKTILSEPSNPSFETFDNIYSEHTNDIKNDLFRLRDLNYYQRTGMRQKKSYLFYGEPGTGKNAMVTAMALFDKRHIIDIPFDKIRTNNELDELLNLTSINGVDFKKNQIIIMFDEIHVGLEKICNQELFTSNLPTQMCEDSTPLYHLINDSSDKVNMGNILSLFDGSQAYNGIIFVGLTNYIDKICEPLKRPGRLTPKYFTYMRQIDIQNLLNNFFQVSLSEQQINQIPDRKITPAYLRIMCELYEQLGVDALLEQLLKENLE
jgi:hypothetical protein